MSAVESACQDYAEYLDVDLSEKLKPINQSIDDMLTRMEEFETIVLLIQQERCNAMGLTGSLTDCIDIQPQLQSLCQRIDTLETLTERLKSVVNMQEQQVEAMEDKLAIDNGNLFKSFLKSSLFKKSSTVNPNQPPLVANFEDLSVSEYFSTPEN